MTNAAGLLRRRIGRGCICGCVGGCVGGGCVGRRRVGGGPALGCGCGRGALHVLLNCREDVLIGGACRVGMVVEVMAVGRKE